MVGVALCGPLVAPHDPAAIVDIPYASAGVLGTDGLGRDVLSRVLHGGRYVVLLSVLVVLAAEVIGVAAGLWAGVQRGPLASVFLRFVDVLLALPALLVLAVLAAGFGSGAVLLFVATIIVIVPGLVRIIYSATLELVGSAWLEASILAGESRHAILFREILPNIAQVVRADAGVRLLGAIFLISSAGFLGFGPQPPTADWGLMINENRSGIELQPVAVLAPAIAIAAFAVGVNLMSDDAAERRDRAAGRAA
jgi:ABC-type dipeptide/oligopeptide/nickel transport system permease subunit